MIGALTDPILFPLSYAEQAKKWKPKEKNPFPGFFFFTENPSGFREILAGNPTQVAGGAISSGPGRTAVHDRGRTF